MSGAKKKAGSSLSDRIIVHVDADCFEVQTYQLEHPATRGQPCIVANKLGRVTSISYEARALGISRKLRLHEAQEKCTDPELIVFLNDRESYRVKDTAAREISKKIQTAVNNFLESNCENNVAVEVAGNDEFWLDFTAEVNRRINENVNISKACHSLTISLESADGSIPAKTNSIQDFLPHMTGISENSEITLKLLHGAEIAAELIQTIFDKTEIQCSAGVGTNKLIAKLAGALNKPAGLTICPPSGVTQMSGRIPINTIPRLKGKLGEKIENLLKCETMLELSLVSEEVLIENKFGASEIRLIGLLSHGKCEDLVQGRSMPSGLKFTRKFDEIRENIIEPETFEPVLLNLCEGFWKRLEEEEKLNARKLKIGSVSLKREERSINVPFDPMTCTSGNDIFEQILPRFRNSVDPAYEPWSNVIQISFNGKQFRKIV